jgi:environmental stress-induced protein Ves
MPRLITADGQRRMPWRNGRGETREIVAWPLGATLDTFQWRVSVATIARSGPFSRFPGVMRTLVLLSGAGVRLTTGNRRIDMTRCHATATLPGDEETACELTGSAVEMFNVMVRGATAARVVVSEGDPNLLPAARFRVCYAAQGALGCEVGAARFELGTADALVLAGNDDTTAELRIAPRAAGARAVTTLIDAASAA